MTTIYFVRHAEPNFDNHNDRDRELTKKGMLDRELVTCYLKDKNIDAVVSSPYLRALDTVRHFSNLYNHEIDIIEGFRERKSNSEWIEDFSNFNKRQWNDFSYKMTEGESLADVQNRNIEALYVVLNKYKDKNVVIGCHGTALSTVIKYYDNSFGYEDYKKIKMPWIIKFTFESNLIKQIEFVGI